MCGIAEVSAQTTPSKTEGFSGIANGRTIMVIDDTGIETSGRLLRFTAEELTIAVDGRDRTFERRRVEAIYQRGDSVKNGMAIGFFVGAAAGFATGVRRTECGDHDYVTGYQYSHVPCTGTEKVTEGLTIGALTGLLGVGIGAGIDKIIPGRRLLYERPKQAGTTVFSIVPSLAPSRLGLLTSVSW